METCRVKAVTNTRVRPESVIVSASSQILKGYG